MKGKEVKNKEAALVKEKTQQGQKNSKGRALDPKLRGSDSRTSSDLTNCVIWGKSPSFPSSCFTGQRK